jgi:hypothetical protein
MKSPRPSRVVEVVREGIHLLRYADHPARDGGLHFGFDSHDENLRIPAKELSAVLDLKDMEAIQSLGPSLAHGTFFHQKNAGV